MRLSRRYVLKAAMATLVVGNAHADEEPVIAPVQRLVDGLQQVMKAGSAGASFTQRFDLLAPIVDRSFNLNAILQGSVSNTVWAALSADQQGMLLAAFRQYTIATYVNSFDKFDGQQFTVSATTKVVGNDQIVQTRIVSKTGEGHEIDYVMRDTRVVDVLLDGSISRVAVQRSDWRRLLRDGGVQALADSLHAKSTNISG